VYRLRCAIRVYIPYLRHVCAHIPRLPRKGGGPARSFACCSSCATCTVEARTIALSAVFHQTQLTHQLAAGYSARQLVGWLVTLAAGWLTALPGCQSRPACARSHHLRIACMHESTPVLHVYTHMCIHSLCYMCLHRLLSCIYIDFGRVHASSARIECTHRVHASSAHIECTHRVHASSARIECMH
jgi:hypothetical protein